METRCQNCQAILHCKNCGQEAPAANWAMEGNTETIPWEKFDAEGLLKLVANDRRITTIQILQALIERQSSKIF